MNNHLAPIAVIASLALGASGCATSKAPAPYARVNAQTTAAQFPNIGYATWSDSEPAYRLYPGDEVEVQVPSAPELNKTVTVQPDGRVNLPLLPPVMVADRTVLQAERAIGGAYASQLLRPRVNLTVKAAHL